MDKQKPRVSDRIASFYTGGSPVPPLGFCIPMKLCVKDPPPFLSHRVVQDKVRALGCALHRDLVSVQMYSALFFSNKKFSCPNGVHTCLLRTGFPQIALTATLPPQALVTHSFNLTLHLGNRFTADGCAPGTPKSLGPRAWLRTSLLGC